MEVIYANALSRNDRNKCTLRKAGFTEKGEVDGSVILNAEKAIGLSLIRLLVLI